jgi:hypothetical protein
MSCMTGHMHDLRSSRVPGWVAATCHPAVLHVQAYYYPGPQPPIYGGPGLSGGLVNGVLQGVGGLLGGGRYSSYPAGYSYASYPAGYSYVPSSYTYPPGEMPKTRSLTEDAFLHACHDRGVVGDCCTCELKEALPASAHP